MRAHSVVVPRINGSINQQQYQNNGIMTDASNAHMALSPILLNA